MRTWYGQKWGFRALLRAFINRLRMLLSETIYLKAEAERMWIEANPGAVSVDANNIQSTPLVIRLWMGEGSTKISVQAYLTLKVESVVGTSVTTLYTYNSPTKVSEFSYTIPADKYATANRISVYAYEDSARTKEIDVKLVNVIADNPIPFPRPEAWAAGLTYKNGEILMLDGQVYMWMSRIPGNTSVNPKTDVSSANPSGKWKAYQHWPLLSTSILMAQFALLGKAVFKDEYMYSQFGIDANGGHTEDYRDFGTPAFTPNLMIDLMRGILRCSDANIKGTIDATAGKIGGFDIGAGRIGSIASATGEAGGLSIYDDFISVGGVDCHVMSGNNVFPASLGGAFNAAMRVTNKIANTSPGYGFDVANYGVYADVRNGTKNYALFSPNAPVRATSVYGTTAQLLTISGNSYAIDLSKGNVYFIRCPDNTYNITLPDENSVRRMFGYSSLPSDFAFMFTVVAYPGTRWFALKDIRNQDNNNENIEMHEGDTVTLLLTKVGGFRYQLINHKS